MNNDYDACRSLYRDARLQERPSQGDRHAVRVALATAISAGVHAAAVGASAASLASVAPAATAIGTGAQAASVVASAVGSKGLLQLVLGGKFLSGLMVGAALGTAGLATVIAVHPSPPTSSVMAQQPAKQPVAVSARVHRATPQASPDQPNAQAAPATTTPLLAAPQQPSVQVAPATATPLTVAPLTAAPGSRDVTPRRVPTEPSGSRAPAQTSEKHRLTDETMALASVQDTLSRGDATRALMMLDEQKQRFASGQLGEERAAARILALCSAGRTVDADAARTKFLAQYPNSPLTKRVNSGCDH